MLRGRDDFLIASHLSPDGDTLGSAIALSLALEATGKKSAVFSKDGVPRHYDFLPRSERVITSLDSWDAGGSALILVDCNHPSRAALEGVSFASTSVIDHHETERDYGDIRWVEPRSPATGLMVLGLLNDMGVRITRDIAVNLYAAIAVDTGTFRFRNTDAEVLRAAAALTEAGSEPGLVAESLYQTWSMNQFKLLCGMIGRTELSGGMGITSIPVELFTETGTTYRDTENFVNFPLLMKDVQVSALMREVEKGLWKVSFRSKGDINVSRVAESFGGGGHRNAAGCSVTGDLKSVKRRLVDAIRKLEGVG
jgi:phosphoesterase RecJ-like protein